MQNPVLGNFVGRDLDVRAFIVFEQSDDSVILQPRDSLDLRYPCNSVLESGGESMIK